MNRWEQGDFCWRIQMCSLLHCFCLFLERSECTQECDGTFQPVVLHYQEGKCLWKWLLIRRESLQAWKIEKHCRIFMYIKGWTWHNLLEGIFSNVLTLWCSNVPKNLYYKDVHCSIVCTYGNGNTLHLSTWKYLNKWWHIHSLKNVAANK